ncbi:hypothetical protein NQ317_011795 [Molorchus minor]|uniref:ZAD domain-containing protein n=1 Tax=Molorchus minor TaxID=1323400 RepID=A0ABQ9J6B6_9CUCU|nr:hypothetical protein NQ317_011795 [Molorchus minor]
MLIKKENICRLCLNGVDGEFEVIDEVTREIFNILLLNVDVTTTKDPIVCTNCFDKIQTFFSFKSVCFSSEELIATYVRSKDVTPINIMDVFLKKPQPVDSVIYKAYNICRLCMYCGKGGNFFSLSALEGYIADEVIAKCIPEVI